MDEHGKWLPKSRKVYDLDENGERIKLPSGRWKSHKEDTVDWNDRKYCEIWRHEWEVIQNRYLEANNRPERVDALLLHCPDGCALMDGGKKLYALTLIASVVDTNVKPLFSKLGVA